MINPFYYFSSVRHLKPRQIYYQLMSRIKSTDIKFKDVSLPPISICIEHRTFDFVPRWTGGKFDIQGKVFEFIELEVKFPDVVDWNEERHGGLWLDHLHYFRYLEKLPSTADSVRLAINLIRDWHKNRRSARKAYWPPYNASERIFCMSRWFITNYHLLSENDKEFLLSVIYHDIDFVCDNLEFKLDGNHLLKNISSVKWGTLFFDIDINHKWKRCIRKHYREIILEQILPDGLHYEKSFIYHQLALIDFLDLLALDSNKNSDDYIFLYNNVKKMASAHEMLIHPGGSACMFNDSPLNLSSSPIEVLNHSKKLLGCIPKVKVLPDSGYFNLADSDMYIVMDAGSLGPDNQMGHSHSDMLHFELSWKGTSVLIEAGTSSYYCPDRRPYERSTVGHNTATVEGDSQAVNWGNFRVARRGKCLLKYQCIKQDFGEVIAAHDGFEQKHRIVHNRQAKYDGSSFIIADSFIGLATKKKKIQLNYHFADSCSVDLIDKSNAIISINGENVLRVSISKGNLAIKPMEYALKYNKLRVGTLLSIADIDEHVETTFYPIEE